jgi:hypothetical protein
MSDVDDVRRPLNVLICDPDSYSTAALEMTMKRVDKVRRVETARTIEDARRYLRGSDINAVVLDPLGLGLDQASDFVFGIRAVFPEIVFVLYVDMMAVDANKAAFYAGQRHRFNHYFKLDKRTALFLFEEEVYAVLRAVQFDIPRNLSAAPVTGLLAGQEGGALGGPSSAEPSGGAGLREIFSLNLGELRAKVSRFAVDETIKRSALALIEDLSRIDRIGKIDPEAAIGKARAVTESIVTPLYLRQGGESGKPLFTMIDRLRDQGVLPVKIWSLLHTVRVVGNLSVHYRPDALDRVTSSDVSLIGMITAQIIEWYIAPEGQRQGKMINLLGMYQHFCKLPQMMINLLGMYQHFCKLLSQDVAWNPWAPATPEPKIHSSRVSVSDGLSRVEHAEGAIDGRAKFVPHANCPSGPSPGTAPQTLSVASRTP